MLKFGRAYYIAASTTAACIDVLDRIIDAARSDLNDADFRGVYRVSHPVYENLLEAGRVSR